MLNEMIRKSIINDIGCATEIRSSKTRREKNDKTHAKENRTTLVLTSST